MAKGILIGLILLSALRTGLLAPRRFANGQDLGEVKWKEPPLTASEFRINTTKFYEGHSNVKKSDDSNEALESLLLNDVLVTQTAVKVKTTKPLKNEARIKTTARAASMTSKSLEFFEISEDAKTVQIDLTTAASPVSRLPTRSSLYTEEAHKTEKNLHGVTTLHDMSGSPLVLTTDEPEANWPTPQEAVTDTVDLGYFFASQVGHVSTIPPMRTTQRPSDKSGLGLQSNKRETRSVTQTPLFSSTLKPDGIAVKSATVPTSSFSSVSLLDYQMAHISTQKSNNELTSPDPLADKVSHKSDQKPEASSVPYNPPDINEDGHKKEKDSAAPSVITTVDVSNEPIIVELRAGSLGSLSSSDPSSEVNIPTDLIPSETYSVTEAILSTTSMPSLIAAEVTYLPIDVSFVEVEKTQTSSQEPENLVTTPTSLSVDSKDEDEASTHVPNSEVPTTLSKPADLDNDAFTSTREDFATPSSSNNPLEVTVIPLATKEATQVETIDHITESNAVQTPPVTVLPEKKPSQETSTALEGRVPNEIESVTETSTFMPNEIQADLTGLQTSAITSLISSSYGVMLDLTDESKNDVTTPASTSSLAGEDQTPDAFVTPSSSLYLHGVVDKNQEEGFVTTDSSIEPTLIIKEVTQAKSVDHAWETDTTSTIASALSSGGEDILPSAHESESEVTTPASTPSLVTEDQTPDASITHSTQSDLHQEVDKNQQEGFATTDSSTEPLHPTEPTLIIKEVTQAKSVDYAWETDTTSLLPEKALSVESSTLHDLTPTETESVIQYITDKQSENQALSTQAPTSTITPAISSGDESILTLAHESENEVTIAASTPSLATKDETPDASSTHSIPSYLHQEVGQNQEGLTSTDSSIDLLDPTKSTLIATEVTQAKTVDYAWEVETCLGSTAFSSLTDLPENVPSVPTSTIASAISSGGEAILPSAHESQSEVTTPASTPSLVTEDQTPDASVVRSSPSDLNQAADKIQEKDFTTIDSSIYPFDPTESSLVTYEQSESSTHLVDLPASTVASIQFSDDEAKLTLAQNSDHEVSTAAAFSPISNNDNIPDSLTTLSSSVPVDQTEATATAATITDHTTKSALPDLMSSTSLPSLNSIQDEITIESIPSTSENVAFLPDPAPWISDDPAVPTTMSPSSEIFTTDSSQITVEEVTPILNPETFVPTLIIPGNPATEAALLQTESEPFPFAGDITLVESETQPGVTGNGVTEGIPLDSTTNKESVTHSLDLMLALPTQETISDAVTEEPSVALISLSSFDVTSEPTGTEPDNEADATESDLSRSEESPEEIVESPDLSPESPPSSTAENDDTFTQVSPSLPTFSDAVEFSTVEPNQGVSDNPEETSTDSLSTSTESNEETTEESELDPVTVRPVSEYTTKANLPNQAEETDDDKEATEEPQTMVLQTSENTNLHKATGPLTNLSITARPKAPESSSPEEEDKSSEQGEEEEKDEEKAEEGEAEEKEDEKAEEGEEDEDEKVDEEEEEEKEDADEMAIEGEEKEGGIEKGEEEEKGTEEGEEEDKEAAGKGGEEEDNTDSVTRESLSSTEGETTHTSLKPNLSAGSCSTESGKEPFENSDSSTELNDWQGHGSTYSQTSITYTSNTPSKSSFGYSQTSTSKRPSQYSGSSEDSSVSAGIENSDEDLRPSTPSYANFREELSSTESRSDEYTRPTYSRYISARSGIKNVPVDVMSDFRADKTWDQVSNLNEFASAATTVLDTTLASLLYASETPLQHEISSASSQEVHPSVSPTSLSNSPSTTSLPTTITEPTAFASLEKPSKEDSSWNETTLVTNPTTTTEKESFLFTGTPVTITFATVATKEPLADKLYTFESNTTTVFSNAPPTPVWFLSEEGALPRQLTNLTSKEIEQEMFKFFARWQSHTNDLKTIPPLSTSNSDTFNSLNTSDLPILAPTADVSIAKFTVLQNPLTQLGSFNETRGFPEHVQEDISSFSENLGVKLNDSQVDPNSTAFPLIPSSNSLDHSSFDARNKELDEGTDSVLIEYQASQPSSLVDLMGDKQRSIEAFFQKWKIIIEELLSRRNSSSTYNDIALTPSFTTELPVIPTQFSSTPSSSTQSYRQTTANFVTEPVISSKLKPLEIPQRRIYSTKRPLKFRLMTAAPPYLSQKGKASNKDAFFRKLLRL